MRLGYPIGNLCIDGFQVVLIFGEVRTWRVFKGGPVTSVTSVGEIRLGPTIMSFL